LPKCAATGPDRHGARGGKGLKTHDDAVASPRRLHHANAHVVTIGFDEMGEVGAKVRVFGGKGDARDEVVGQRRKALFDPAALGEEGVVERLVQRFVTACWEAEHGDDAEGDFLGSVP